MATIYYLTWHHSGPTEHDEASEFFHEAHIETPAALSRDRFDTLYEEVGQVDIDADNLEEAWRQWNRGSGNESETFLDKEIRSMCVGDVIQVEGEYYIAASCGWNRLDIDGGEPR